ncbi:MAG: ester cyclase [Phycisphaerae bacterium]|jgi:steroid delta-isomerase-like uncharacterized protein
MKSRFLHYAILAMSLSGCAAPGEHIKRENIELVQRQHTDLWSNGDLTVIDESYATDFLGHFPGETVRGPAGIRSSVLAHRTSFPDWTETVEDTIAEGDRIVTRFRSQGTNLGEFSGKPATGRRVEITEVCIFRIVDGWIVEQWVYPDLISMQRQLHGE